MTKIRFKIDKTLPKCGYKSYCGYVLVEYCHYNGPCEYKPQGAAPNTERGKCSTDTTGKPNTLATKEALQSKDE